MALLNLRTIALIAYSVALIVLLALQFSWPPSPLSLFLVVNLLILSLLTSGGFFRDREEELAIVLVARPPEVQVEEIPYRDLPTDAVVLSIEEEHKGALVPVLDLPHFQDEHLPNHTSLDVSLVSIDKSTNPCTQLVVSSSSSSMNNNDEKSLVPVSSPRRRKKKKGGGSSSSSSSSSSSKKGSNVDINLEELLLVRNAPPLAMTLQMDGMSMDDFNRSCASFIQVKKCEMQQERKQEWRLALTQS